MAVDRNSQFATSCSALCESLLILSKHTRVSRFSVLDFAPLHLETVFPACVPTSLPVAQRNNTGEERGETVRRRATRSKTRNHYGEPEMTFIFHTADCLTHPRESYTVRCFSNSGVLLFFIPVRARTNRLACAARPFGTDPNTERFYGREVKRKCSLLANLSN